MVARAVSGAKLLAPLAVLVPILATLIAAVWAYTISPPLALPVSIAGLATTAAAGRRFNGSRVPLIAGAWTLLAAPVGLFLWVAIITNADICGKDIGGGWMALGLSLGAIVFLALGSVGLHTNRAKSIVPMAMVAGVLAALLVYALAPGTQGYCD